jgi:hypothetical protein
MALTITLLVYLFSIIIGIVAIAHPYLTTTSMGIEIELYVNKMCAKGNCMPMNTMETNTEDTSFLVHISTTLYALFIIFTILTGVCFTLCALNKNIKYVNSGVGLLLFLISIVTLITLIVAGTHKYSANEFGVTSFNFTPTSILMIIVCCFMIINQVIANNVLRSIPSMIMHK